MDDEISFNLEDEVRAFPFFQYNKLKTTQKSILLTFSSKTFKISYPQEVSEEDMEDSFKKLFAQLSGEVCFYVFINNIAYSSGLNLI